MTHEQAYAAGFCKAAEAVGVDPFALVKRAQLLGRLVNGIKGGVRRYGELLGGGKMHKYEDQVASMDRLIGKATGPGIGSVQTGSQRRAIVSRAMRQRAIAKSRLLKEREAVERASRNTILGVAGTAGAIGAGFEYRHNKSLRQQPKSSLFGLGWVDEVLNRG